MAIILETNYAKKIGLRNYSSHQYSVTVRTEVSDLSKIEAASAHLYQQLQEAVDKEIQNSGFLPGDEGQQPRKVVPFNRGGAGTSPAPRNNASPASEWGCSDKQKALILKLMKENDISFESVDELARHRFNCDLKDLHKIGASSIIDEIIDRTSKRSRPRGRSHSPSIDKGGE